MLLAFTYFIVVCLGVCLGISAKKAQDKWFAYTSKKLQSIAVGLLVFIAGYMIILSVLSVVGLK
jgi:ABC-type dipeptide/oligopeptide/nickel transport system permease component